MIYEFILIHFDKRKKRNKLSRIHLKMGGFAKVCFGYKVVTGNPMTTVLTLKFSFKMTDITFANKKPINLTNKI